MNKKVNYLIILTFLLVVILGSSYAYSKYRSDASGSAQADVANWNITVNDCSITNPDKNNTTCFSETIDEDSGEVNLVKNFGVSDITYNNNGNDNVVDNKIAPGSSGTFKISIKPNDTEVSFKYTLNVSLETENAAIRLYRSDPNSDNKILIEDNGFSNIIKYSDNNADYEETITIYVEWISEIDDAGNQIDTSFGTNGGQPKLNIPVSITFEQYNG